MHHAPEGIAENRMPPGAGKSDLARADSLNDASRRFAAVFYRIAVDSMMSTIPGREETFPVGSAGWQFLGRYLPRELARKDETGLTSYIRESLSARQGGQVNVRM